MLHIFLLIVFIIGGRSECIVLAEYAMYECALNEFDFTCAYICECWKFFKSHVFNFASHQILLISHVSNFAKKDGEY